MLCAYKRDDGGGGGSYSIRRERRIYDYFQVGKNYLCRDWKQELITFSQFLERIQSNSSSSDVPTYLAQHPLFDQVCFASFIDI